MDKPQLDISSCLYVYIYTHKCVCVHVYMYICIYIYIHTYNIYMYVYVYIHIQTYIHIHTYVYIYIHTYTYIYIHIYIYIHTYAYIHWPSFATQQRKVPARFQDCSSFSGRAFSLHQSPAPEIETQQIRCWEYMYIIYIHIERERDIYTHISHCIRFHIRNPIYIP